MCGGQLVLLGVTNLHRHGPTEWYSCSQCPAQFYRVEKAGESFYGPYAPIDEQWAAGYPVGTDPSDPTATLHAIGDGTLCGLSRDHVTVYRHHFDPAGPNACTACVATAQKIDARWPLEKR